MVRRSNGVLIALLLPILWSTDARAEWTRFRGPNGTGVSDGNQAPPIEFGPTKHLKWKAQLPGPGSSSPIVVGDQVLVTCWSGYGTDRGDPGDQQKLKRHLVSIDRATGETRWDREVPAVLPEDRYGGMFAENGYASHTPVSDGKRVFVFFGKTGVLAFDLEGKQLWQTSVGTESGAKGWGSASSPILYKNLVIVPATAESEALVALDQETGKEVWRQEASGFSATWGSPVLVDVHEDGGEARQDIVLAVPYEVWGFNPDTGKLRWYCDGIPSRSMCSSVVAHDGIVYAVESGPDGGGGVAVRVGGKGDVTDSHVVWTNSDRARIATPVVVDGRLYYFSGNVVNCADVESGKRLYQSRLEGNSSGGSSAEGGFGGRRRGGGGQNYASPVVAGGRLYYVARSGDVHVLKPGPEFEQLATNRVTTDREDFSATPAVSDGALYIRSSRHLYCVAE